MSSKIIAAYFREVCRDLRVTGDESDEIKKKLTEVNPPPDKLVWIRASAFRIGSEFLTDNKDKNNALLKCVNAIVHAIETTCMTPKVEENERYDTLKTEKLIHGALFDRSVNRDEAKAVAESFKNNPPSKSKLIWTRVQIFKTGSALLTSDKQKNMALFKSMNYLVHIFEATCLKPRPFELKTKLPVGGVSISDAAQNLWDLDVNRLDPNDDYRINVQGGKLPYWKSDGATDPLFQHVDKESLERPTYQAFIELLDNYSAVVGKEEKVTYEERKENFTFLQAIMETGPMQYCHRYCVEHGKDVPKDKKGFVMLLHKIWFELYRRAGNGRDSSGFEHVFVGEIKDGKVTGFHNWIYFYLEEKRGTVDYRGYIKPRSRKSAHTNGDDQVLTLQFKWRGVLKNVGTSFIGVSPEFEMALYTMCFLAGKKGADNIIDLDTGNDQFKLNCKVYDMARDKIGTSFVEALEHHD